MNILGISAFYHESSCCLLCDGRLVAAASEERFSRVKHDPRLPVEAFRFCLRQGGLDILDVDALAYYESPVKKLARQLWAGIPEDAPLDLPWFDPLQPERAIRQRLGYEGPILSFDHHQSHAASAFLFSGFPDAAILTVDGVGEWATTTYGRGQGANVELFEQVDFPHSLGLLYSTITAYLGFKVNSNEYKVMGLAPYGEPSYADKIRAMITSLPGGQYALDLKYFDFIRGSRMYTPELVELLGAAPRIPESEVTQFHKDMARSLQFVLEEILVEKAKYLGERVGSPRLCMAGGVALNIVANSRILADGPFEELFVQPAAGDAGGCLGAAALAYVQLTGEHPNRERMQHCYYGPSYPADAVARIVAATGLPAVDYRGREADMVAAVADLLVDHKVVGWFHGAMEFGPRALGARSILANPMDPDIRDRVNRSVKKREGFRPFAPAVLEGHAREHFDLDHPSPFMLEICQVTSPLALPGITHVDNSARPQTVNAQESPRFAALLEAFFERTGCPLVLNTSFNVRGEPIICTPADALFCMGNSEIDVLVLEDFLLHRSQLPANWEQLFPVWRIGFRSPMARGKSAISENLYTFV